MGHHPRGASQLTADICPYSLRLLQLNIPERQRREVDLCGRKILHPEHRVRTSHRRMVDRSCHQVLEVRRSVALRLRSKRSKIERGLAVAVSGYGGRGAAEDLTHTTSNS